MRILGIETSCDDTGAAVYDAQRGLLAHRRYSQIKLHARYGGVVPELAARDHVRKLLPLIEAVLREAGTPRTQAVAYTAGPGLAGALLVGAALGRGLAWSWGVPVLGIHHMEAHLLAIGLEKAAPGFPFLGLLVSGGHTLLVEVRALGDYRVLGQTLDDAVGEAFDKAARTLGLGYPGGPAIAQAARQGRAGRFVFPRPMMSRPGLDFSFSGLKTYTLNAVRDQPDDAQTRADLACAFETAAVETLVGKTRRALEQTGLPAVVIAGGVGANTRLREQMAVMAREQGAAVFFPRPEFCTDNGAMIACAGYQRLRAGERAGPGLGVRPRWHLSALPPPGQPPAPSL